MVFKNFYISLIIRIVLLVITSILFAFEFNQTMKVYTAFLLFILIVIQAILLIRFTNRLNNQFLYFFELIKDKDTKYRFMDKKALASLKVTTLLNELADTLYTSRVEGEKKNQYLKFVIENAEIGLFVYNDEGRILFCNNTTLKLLKIEKLDSIDKLDLVDIRLKPLVKSISSTSQHKQIKLRFNDEYANLSIGNSYMKIENESINLVSIQDIKAELDEKELESWQRIIRILTHEIMNSIAPINSLTYSIKRSLSEKKENNELLGISEIAETISDIEVIERRGNNLIKFVENYRKIAKIGIAKPKEFNLEGLITNIQNLFKAELSKKGITFEFKSSSSITINADESLFEQALINLVKNSIDALKDTSNPKIEVSIQKVDNDTIIKISDNGVGIPKDKIDDIFVPFFTTKENGSGIGLSLVKQILRLHKGTIDVVSQPNLFTTFTLKF
jgi:two-component system nitrogen regulation sensor histidine kinase NtrY